MDECNNHENFSINWAPMCSSIRGVKKSVLFDLCIEFLMSRLKCLVLLHCSFEQNEGYSMLLGMTQVIITPALTLDLFKYICRSVYCINTF